MNKIRRISKVTFLISTLVLLTALFSSCAAEKPKPLTILHTNDIHGHFVPDPASWLDDKPPVGGFVAMDYYIRQERASSIRSLLLDAGDIMTGNLICSKEYKGAYGGALIEMMNIIGYDCGVIGNHEFDKPVQGANAIANINGLVDIAEFPFVLANLVDSSGNEFPLKQYEIFNVDGLKVGVIGVTYHQMLGMASSENLEKFYTVDPAEVVNKIVPTIDPQTDVIIVLSHLGIGGDREMAERIKDVDIIVGAHSHTRLKQPEKVNGVLIVQAGSYNHDLGRLDLMIAGDTVYSYSGKLITPMVEGTKPRAELKALVDSFATVIDDEYGVAIGTLNHDWRGVYQGESNVGDWITDAIRAQAKSDVAFINSGGIRKNIPAGPVTIRDIMEMLPFQNYVEIFECSGAELKTIIHENARAQKQKTHGTLQLSGVTYSWREKGDDVELVDIKVGGKKLKDNATYKIASIDYVNGNYDKYFTLKPKELQNTGMLIADIVIDAIKKAGTIDSQIDHRIKRIN